jgi:beta-glucosidase
VRIDMSLKMNKWRWFHPGSGLLLLGTLMIAALAFAQGTTQSSAQVEKRADDLLSKMTFEEKITLIGGVNDFYIRPIARLGLPPLRMSDGPMGVHDYGETTAYAAGIALAASWDTDLANRVGIAMGRDARARGVHFILAPGMNIYRAPMNGRNFEYLGEDPYLASRMAVPLIEGIQSQGVIATAKHFVANNMEYGRMDHSSDVDERTLREIYLPAFEASVKEASVGALMDAYNLVNGTYMTQNGYLNNTVVKKEWGFNGIMMSDWGATHDGIAAANNGLDLEMPSAAYMNTQTLLPAIQRGEVSTAAIDDKVRRILRKAIEFGFYDREQTDSSIPLYSQEGRGIALEEARSGMVLLKNENNFLPLDKEKIKTIAVLGPDAYPAVIGGGKLADETF